MRVRHFVACEGSAEAIFAALNGCNMSGVPPTAAQSGRCRVAQVPNAQSGTPRWVSRTRVRSRINFSLCVWRTRRREQHFFATIIARNVCAFAFSVSHVNTSSSSFMPIELPILSRRDEIDAAIRSHQVVVICGETGSGKSTQLPQMCLDIDVARGVAPCRIAHTQPRRIAARSIAARIAEERGGQVGGEVGYKVRFQDVTSKATRIKVMTDGMLLAELAADRELGQYSTIIIDEAHERSLNIDFALGVLRDLLKKRRELRLIVTSATIEPARFSEYFGGAKVAPVIEVSGRTYPIEIKYHAQGAPESSRGARGEFESEVNIEYVCDEVMELHASRAGSGDVLVFLPGEREIRGVANRLESAARQHGGLEVLPLFSRLTNAEQDRIFHRTNTGLRRVILATNVAETSLTVPGIRFVVDTGLARISRYSPASKVQRLPVEAISRASANQRAGRCGRVAAGVCVRMYSQESFNARPVLTDPEIRRASLAGVILQMRSLNLGDPETFAFLDPPTAAAIQDGYDTLCELGAITAASRDGTLTEIGTRIAKMPVDPRVARMLIAAAEAQCLDEVVPLAAVLSIQDPRERPSGRQEEAELAQSVFRDKASDFLTLLNVWNEYRGVAEDGRVGEVASWCREHFLSFTRMREWADTTRQLHEVAEELGFRSESAHARQVDSETIHKALLAGLITNVAAREDGASHDYRGVRGNVVHIFPGSALFKKNPRWIMAAEIVQTTRLFARTVAAIEPGWIEQVAGHMFRRQMSDYHLDADTGEARAFERVTMSGIVVVPRRAADLASRDRVAARKVFVEEALAGCRWRTDLEFQRHNRGVLESVATAQAKLRKRNVALSAEEIAAWFEERVAKDVVSPSEFGAWYESERKDNPDVVKLRLRDVLRGDAAAALTESNYPDSIEVAGAAAPLVYELAPGKDADGLTVTVTLAQLAELKKRAPWLVRGMLADVLAGHVKALPKTMRAKIEEHGGAEEIAETLAGTLGAVGEFGQSDLTTGLSSALGALCSVTVAPSDWPVRALAPHLRMRVRVVDDAGKQIAVDRDIDALLTKFQAKLAVVAAAPVRSAIEQVGLRTWSLESFPERVFAEPGNAASVMYPAMVDRESWVDIVLFEDQWRARAMHRLGVRRLFVLATREELEYSIDALPQWREMVKYFAALGGEAQLRDALLCMTAERVFMESQAPVEDELGFLERLDEQRPRLISTLRDTGDIVAKILEPRFRVAHRIASGTSRAWATSVADIREHAAYLMPRGFLSLVPASRLREFPKYSSLMRERLFSMREEGSRAETDALGKFLPYWKRFTAWVANAMSAERRELEAAGEAVQQQKGTRTKAPLPQARRVAPAVNLDAGEWALVPGNLPKAVEEYRWQLEDARVVLFGQEVAGKARVDAAMSVLEERWKRMGM